MYMYTACLSFEELASNFNFQIPIGKQLFEKEDCGRSVEPWTENEIKALVDFILFHGAGEKWPTTKNDTFWRKAALFVKERSGVHTLRTSKYLSMNTFCSCTIYMYIN